MAESSDDQERTEPATPRRLQRAREEGQVPRSRELTTFVLLLGGVAGLWGFGPVIQNRLRLAMEQAFLFQRQHAFDAKSMMLHVANLSWQALLALLPLLLVLVLLALAAPMLLGGWAPSAKSLAPRAAKLNPIKGLGRLFSSQALAELSKGIAKCTLVGGVLVGFLVAKRGEFMALLGHSATPAILSAVDLAAAVCAIMVAALLAVVLIDVPYQLWSHAKKLRMTKEEVKREHKETEGDPLLRARIRSQQQAMARRRMMSQVKTADVVVTNPTHYAVALRYDESTMSAPRVVAKGVDAVAQRIIELARDHGVPSLEAAALARALYRHVELDREVPSALYTAVAEVMAWAYQLRMVPDAPEPRELAVPPELDLAKNPAGDRVA